MKKKGTTLKMVLISLLVLSLLIIPQSLALGQQETNYGVKQIRLGGADRYRTAVRISEEGWNQANTVVLANSMSFHDALVGTSLAFLKNAPILITATNSLEKEVLAEIQRLQAKTIYILGNEQLISSSIENQLKNSYQVIRLGDGDKLGTAVKVGEEIRTTQKFKTVFIATQENFPDALAAAPISAKFTYPILFSQKDSLRSDTKKALSDWGISQVYIVGGEGVVSSKVENELIKLGINPIRIGGADRYLTALYLAQRFESLPANNSGYTNLVLATGSNFPDALTGAVLAAKNNAPLLLVGKDFVKKELTNYVRDKKINNLYVLGGTGVVAAKAANTVNSHIPSNTAVTREEFSVRGVKLGDSQNSVIQQLGEPARKDLSKYGFDWYIYNQDYNNYSQVGIQDGKVVGLYANTTSLLSMKGLTIGTPKDAAEKFYFQGNSPLEVPGHSLVGDFFLTLFYDVHLDNTIMGIQIIDKDYHNWHFRVQADERLRTSYEKQIFDLANATRAQLGKPAFVWNDQVAQVARNHSRDMAENNYFNHVNLKAQNPRDRLIAAGLTPCSWGWSENCAQGHETAIDVHHAWMNSLTGHRESILSGCKNLGVGVWFAQNTAPIKSPHLYSYIPYYTQNFFTPK